MRRLNHLGSLANFGMLSYYIFNSCLRSKYVLYWAFLYKKLGGNLFKPVVYLQIWHAAKLGFVVCYQCAA